MYLPCTCQGSKGSVAADGVIGGSMVLLFGVTVVGELFSSSGISIRLKFIHKYLTLITKPVFDQCFIMVDLIDYLTLFIEC